MKVVRAEYGHLPLLAENLRESDKVELYAAMGGSTFSSLVVSFECSVAHWCLLVDGQPVLIWGVAPHDSLLSDAGMPWMVGTDTIDDWQIYLARRVPRYLHLMHALYPRLINYAHAQNRKALRFLRWCGFSIASEPQYIGTELFYEVRRDICVV